MGRFALLASMSARIAAACPDSCHPAAGLGHIEGQRGDRTAVRAIEYCLLPIERLFRVRVMDRWKCCTVRHSTIWYTLRVQMLNSEFSKRCVCMRNAEHELQSCCSSWE